MSETKKTESKEQKTQTPAAEQVVQSKPVPPASGGDARPRPGDIVYYYKNVQTQTGNKTEEYPALVLGYPKEGSNFQKKDMALDLKVFSCAQGGADEVKHGVIHAPTKTPQRWTFR